jgi:Xaa-Pro aminopeptidase
MNAKERLKALREQMRRRGVTAYYIPTTDPHQSEYVPDHWLRRGWFSGFTGSSGDVLVTMKEAGLWTDGRYFLQAAAELKGSGITLHKLGEPGVLRLVDYLPRVLDEGDALGVDPRVVSIKTAQEIRKALRPVGARLTTIDENLVDAIWTDRPAATADPVHLLPPRFAGESTASKLKRVRRAMAEQKVEAHVLTVLDTIAWLMNLRGRDVEFNPVAISYALVTSKEAFLFIDPRKVPAAIVKKLAPHVTVRPYEGLADALRELASRKARVWVDPAQSSLWIAGLLEGCPLVEEPTPIALMKSKKNATEIDGMRAAHVRDGVAVVRFLAWLEKAVPKGGVTEISAADVLGRFREHGEHFQGLSFRTISGYAGHGAIVHYSVTPKTDVPLRPEGIYLVDSGGQYLDGTTDITRTVLLGRQATKEQKDRFTRVLQGHIALARAKFPSGVRGVRLDTLARLPLWAAGMDYNHGTGHGVGAYLNVHEGPQSIAPRGENTAPLEPGNILSNEPGYYEEGAYGIRIESLILVVEAVGHSRNGKPFLGFETITMCPIETRLLEPKLLEPEERAWLNGYHKTVYKALSPHLSAPEKTWLKKACAAV